jgi:monoamine oxidase
VCGRRGWRAGSTSIWGGQWIGEGQERIAAVVEELGIRTYPQHTDGRILVLLNGRRRSSRVISSPLPIFSTLFLARAVRELDRMSEEVPLGAPEQARQAREWDAMTVESWILRAVRGETTQAAIRQGVRALFCAEPGEISFLHFLFYLRSGGGFVRMISTEGGAQGRRIHGGAQHVAERMAAPLGERVHLRVPVRSVGQDARSVVLRSGAGDFRAARVIIAIPPALTSVIDWDPPLPPGRAQLVQRIPMGSVIKCIALYPTPFWREQGWSGEVVSDEGPVTVVLDASPPNGSCGALVAFLVGNSARYWGARGADQREARVLAQLASFFGSAAGSPLAFVDAVWAADEWSRGGYGGVLPPGVLTGLGRSLRAPIGRVHWAGTETATVWTGYMDGAVESGERAAAEVMREMEGD